MEKGRGIWCLTGGGRPLFLPDAPRSFCLSMGAGGGKDMQELYLCGNKILVQPFLCLIPRRTGFRGLAGSGVWPLIGLRWDSLITASCEAARPARECGWEMLFLCSFIFLFLSPPRRAELGSSVSGPSCGCLLGKGSPPGWQSRNAAPGKVFSRTSLRGRSPLRAPVSSLADAVPNK